MQLGLAGKVVVVTGASKGIGLAVTRGFVEEGARVIAGVRATSADLEAIAAGGMVDAVVVDLAEPDGPAQLVAAAGDRIDVLINNVGAAPPRLDGFLAITDEMWQQTINLDLMTAVRAIRGALPVMLAGSGGVIVNIGSLNARLPNPAVLDLPVVDVGRRVVTRLCRVRITAQLAADCARVEVILTWRRRLLWARAMADSSALCVHRVEPAAAPRWALWRWPTGVAGIRRVMYRGALRGPNRPVSLVC